MHSNVDLLVRQIIAGHFGVEPQRVTDEARFRDDFGADWLDRLELIIAIEDQVSGFELADVVADQIDTVGDLKPSKAATDACRKTSSLSDLTGAAIRDGLESPS